MASCDMAGSEEEEEDRTNDRSGKLAASKRNDGPLGEWLLARSTRYGKGGQPLLVGCWKIKMGIDCKTGGKDGDDDAKRVYYQQQQRKGKKSKSGAHTIIRHRPQKANFNHSSSPTILCQSST